LPGEETVKGSEDRERTGIEGGRPAGDEGSGAVTALEHAHGGEEADSGAEAGTADLELAGQLTLGGETVARFDLSGGDEGANVFDDLHGELAVRGCVGGDLFFHCEIDSCLRKWEKSNTEGRGRVKLGGGVGGQGTLTVSNRSDRMLIDINQALLSLIDKGGTLWG
jgi:hypothetical protein